MIDLSVIVPVYNTENYLKDCVESIIKNNIKNIEIIIVNDGSPDNSKEVMEKLKQQYPKIIQCVYQKNQGLSMARNTGIKKAKGKYIAFIDSDDTISNKMFKKMLQKATKYDFDIVVCGEERIYKDHKSYVDSGVSRDCFNQSEVKAQMLHIYPAACNKIYKRKIILENLFKPNVWFEDVDFIYRLLPKINSIGIVDGYYYHYMQREGSITYTYNEKIYDFIENMNGLVAYYQENKLWEEYYFELEYVYVRYLYATFVKRLAKMKNKKEYNKGVKIAIKNVKTNFPDYKKHAYFKKGKKEFYLKHFNSFIANFIYYIVQNKEN